MSIVVIVINFAPVPAALIHTRLLGSSPRASIHSTHSLVHSLASSDPFSFVLCLFGSLQTPFLFLLFFFFHFRYVLMMYHEFWVLFYKKKVRINFTIIIIIIIIIIRGSSSRYFYCLFMNRIIIIVETMFKSSFRCLE